MPQFPTTSLSYAPRAGFLSVFPAPLIMQRAPTTSDRALPGTIWVNQVSGSQAAYILIGIFGGNANWVSVEGGAGVFTSLTVTPGMVLINSDNNTGNDVTIETNGGANETIDIINNQGTQIPALEVAALVGGLELIGGAANIAAVNITASNAAGGISNTSGTGGFTVQTTGILGLTSTENANTAVQLIANGGTTERVTVQASQGTSANSVLVNSVAGGVTMNGVTNVTLSSIATNPLINIGNVVPTVARTTTIAGGTVASGIADTINIGTGGVNNGGASKVVNIANSAVTSGTQTVNIANGAVSGGQTQSVNICTGGGAGFSTVTIGGNATNTQILGQGVQVAGTALTINSGVGIGIFTGQTTAAGSSLTVTITNSVVTTNSGIIASVAVVGAEDAQMTVQKIRPLNGSFTVQMKNNGAAALASDLHVSFMVLS